ncbi:MAG: SDR family NAD(P)-dependent oxidoreductase [Bacteroidia bacterium]
MAFTIDLSGKNILVTGASRGIGKGIALMLGEAGATVGVHYGKSQKEAEALVNSIGNGAKAFQADLANSEEVKKLFDDFMVHFGKIDVLVNNAGIAFSTAMDAEENTWLADWNTTMAVNLSAAALLSKLALPHMTEHGGGRLIHIASRAAHRGDTPDYMAYAASKAGMLAMHKTIARFYGKKGICSFAIAPGFTHTDMAQQFIDEYGEAWATNDLALSQLTKPADIAPTVLLMASGMMDHATGAVVDINAGSYIR